MIDTLETGQDWLGDGPRLGVIVAVIGANPGPASGITYKIVVNDQLGQTTYNGVKPSNSRVPDAIDTKAADVSSGVWVFYLGGKAHFLIPEFPDTAAC